MSTMTPEMHGPRRLATQEFALAQNFAVKRATSDLRPQDFLAAVYIVAWERLSRLWANPGTFEELVAEECGLDSPRWTYCIEPAALKPEVRAAGVTHEADDILTAAAKLAEDRRRSGSGEPRVTSEDFLLALIRREDLRLGRVVRESGLDSAKLLRPQRWGT